MLQLPTGSVLVSVNVEPGVEEVILLAVAAQSGQDRSAAGLISRSQLVGTSLEKKSSNIFHFVRAKSSI